MSNLSDKEVELSKVFHHILEMRKVSDIEAAEALGYSEATIRAYKYGRRRIPEDQLNRFLKEFSHKLSSDDISRLMDTAKQAYELCLEEERIEEPRVQQIKENSSSYTYTERSEKRDVNEHQNDVSPQHPLAPADSHKEPIIRGISLEVFGRTIFRLTFFTLRILVILCISSAIIDSLIASGLWKMLYAGMGSGPGGPAHPQLPPPPTQFAFLETLLGWLKLALFLLLIVVVLRFVKTRTEAPIQRATFWKVVLHSVKYIAMLAVLIVVGVLTAHSIDYFFYIPGDFFGLPRLEMTYVIVLISGFVCAYLIAIDFIKGRI